MVAGGGVHLILAADNTRAFARVLPLNSYAVRGVGGKVFAFP
jgi:hypothetical protein